MMRPVTVSNKNGDAKLSLCYPVCTDAAYANCSHRKVLSNLFLWLFSKSIPLKEYYPVRSVEAPTTVCLPAVVGRNKPWSVVPSIHLCLSHAPVRGQMWTLLSIQTWSVPPPSRVVRSPPHSVQSDRQTRCVSDLQGAGLIPATPGWGDTRAAMLSIWRDELSEAGRELLRWVCSTSPRFPHLIIWFLWQHNSTEAVMCKYGDCLCLTNRMDPEEKQGPVVESTGFEVILPSFEV